MPETKHKWLKHKEDKEAPLKEEVKGMRHIGATRLKNAMYGKKG